MKKRLIIFDIGGVISEGFNKKDPFKDTCSEYKISRLEFDKIFYKYFDDYHFNKTLSQYNFWKNILEELGKDVSHKEIEKTIQLFNQNILQDASNKMLNLLKDLSQKYKLVLLSNSFRDMDKAVFSSSYLKYFDRISLTHLNSKKKPLKEAYLEAIAGFNVKPEECVFIDDKIINIEGANNIGMTGIVYKNFDQLINELKNEGVVYY